MFRIARFPKMQTALLTLCLAIFFAGCPWVDYDRPVKEDGETTTSTPQEDEDENKEKEIEKMNTDATTETIPDDGGGSGS